MATIVVVDSDSEMAQTISRFVMESGCTPIVAPTRRDAVALIQTLHLWRILTDTKGVFAPSLVLPVQSTSNPTTHTIAMLIHAHILSQLRLLTKDVQLLNHDWKDISSREQQHDIMRRILCRINRYQEMLSSAFYRTWLRCAT